MGHRGAANFIGVFLNDAYWLGCHCLYWGSNPEPTPLHYQTLTSMCPVLTRGCFLYGQSCLDEPDCVKIDGHHTTTPERESTEALPTKPADHSPIDSPFDSPTADTQATSTQNPRPSALSPAEGYDQLNATPPVNSSETYNYNSQVHSLTTPDSERVTLNSG